MKPVRILHPLMLAIYPILFLFSHNIGELSAQVILLPILISVLATLVLWAVLKKVFSSLEKAALLTSLALFLFFSYGHFEKLLGNVKWVVAGVWLGPTKLLSFAWLVIIAAAVYGLSKSKKSFPALTRFLNLITAFLVVWTLFNSGLFYFKHYRDQSPTPVPAVMFERPVAAGAEDPDIYYIVLDEYLRSDMLQQLYHFDNSAFIRELEQRGFYVAKASRSNYAHTALSVASSLNLRYVNEEAERLAASGSRSRIPLARLINDSQLAKFLRGRGYQFIAMNSGYWGTRIESADEYLSGGNDEFFNQLANTSLLSLEQDVNKRLWGKSLYDSYMTRMQRRRILNVFEQLEKIPERPAAKLVFAHLVSPHPPFIFGANGEVVLFNAKLGLFADDAAGLIGHDDMTHDLFKKRYTDQVRYLNQRLLQTVDVIRSRSHRPVLIILQGDHGPRSLSDWEGSEQLSRRQLMLMERMSILNAYLLPDAAGPQRLYPEISPVNSFRLILNRYFGQRYDLLPDRVYFSTGDRYYHLDDVTELVNTAEIHSQPAADK